MSKLCQELLLDTERTKWQAAIREARAKIARLKRAVAIFTKNIEERVPFPRKRPQRKISALPDCRQRERRQRDRRQFPGLRLRGRNVATPAGDAAGQS